MGRVSPAGLLAARRCERLVREGSARYHRRDVAGAEQVLREAMGRAERSGNERAIARAAQRLYFLLLRQDRPAEAVEALERAVGAHRRLSGPDGRWTAEWRNELIDLLARLGRRGPLEAACRERLASEVRGHGDDSVEAAWAMLTLAWALRSAARWEESETLCRRGLRVIEAIHGPEHPRAGWALAGLALSLRCRGDHAGAEAALRRARTGWACAGHHDRAAAADELLVDLYLEQGRCRDALDLLCSPPAPGCGTLSAERRLRSLELRRDALRGLGRASDAARCEEEACELRRAVEVRRRERDRMADEAPDLPAVACAAPVPIAGPFFPSPLL